MSDNAGAHNPYGSATKQEIEPRTKLALYIAFISFVVPVVPSIVAFVIAMSAKHRLRKAGGDRMNEGLATLAQITSVFTVCLVGGFFWYAERTWGG